MAWRESCDGSRVKTVLVVEDNSDIRELTATVVRRAASPDGCRARADLASVRLAGDVRSSTSHS